MFFLAREDFGSAFRMAKAIDAAVRGDTIRLVDRKGELCALKLQMAPVPGKLETVVLKGRDAE